VIHPRACQGTVVLLAGAATWVRPGIRRLRAPVTHMLGCGAAPHGAAVVRALTAAVRLRARCRADARGAGVPC